MKMTRNPWFGGGENNSSSRTHFAPSHRAASRKSYAHTFPVGAWTFCKCWSWHHVFTLVMMKWNEMKWNEHKPHQHWMRRNGSLHSHGCTSKPSIFKGCFIINHPAIGVPPDDDGNLQMRVASAASTSRSHSSDCAWQHKAFQRMV